MSYLMIRKKTSFNHKHLAPHQYSNTSCVQNEFIVHILHLRIGFTEIWQKSVVMRVKDHEKHGKTTFFDKSKKLTANY